MKKFSIIEDIDRAADYSDDNLIDSVTFFKVKEVTIDAIHRLYHTFDMTVRDVCFVYGVEYKPEYQKLFYNLFGPKGKPHGGARRGTSKIYK